MRSATLFLLAPTHCSLKKLVRVFAQARCLAKRPAGPSKHPVLFIEANLFVASTHGVFMARWILAFALGVIVGASAFKSTVKAQEDPCDERAESDVDYAVTELRKSVKGCLDGAETLEEAKTCSDVDY